MKVLILYRPASEYASATEAFIHDFQVRNPDAKLEVLSIDEREGIATAGLYDIVRYPAILALAGDGSLLKDWQGDELPLIDEVASYAYGG